MPTTFLNLQALLDEAELSQSAVAEMTGVRRATLHSWAHGGSVRADPAAIIALCNVLTEALGREVTVAQLQKKPRK